MKIDILEFAEGARQARGLAVIIDVFRAFSVECYAYDCGASGVIATGSVENAFELRRRYRNSLLVGERNERRIDGFDLGNSPTEILLGNVAGKTIIHTTTAGTCGLENAVNCDPVITGSLVNASAVARYINQAMPGHVSLVAMGYRANVSADEDILCAEYIRSMLRGEERKLTSEIEELRKGAGKRFFDPANIGFSPPTDFFLCTMTDRFEFVLRAERRHDGNLNIERIEI
jgi:2-phosphosulfolactate phosphatase